MDGMGGMAVPKEPAADERLLLIIDSELQTARENCELHERELGRNQRIARACEAARDQLCSDPSGRSV